MSSLARVFPPLQRVKLPLTRDQLMLLMAAINELFLGVDIYLAHAISGTIVPNEWIPIIFGPIAGVLLLLAGLLALRRRDAASLIATVVLAGSIVVGLLGAYFHLARAALPAAPVGQRLTVNLLVWAPPVLGPLMFAMVGLLGISAAWVEEPHGSGVLVLPGGRRLALPYSKTRAYYYIVSMGALATIISAVLDHARTGFATPILWLPVAAGVFAVVVAAMMGIVDERTDGDLVTYFGAMLLLIVVGVVGAVLHINDDLTAGGVFVVERFIRGAPILAPLLFADIGMIGLIVMLDEQEP